MTHSAALTITELKHLATSWSLAQHDVTADALASLAFVQADPIRAPARAQDLILRQRVADYRVGDLERAYPLLNVTEDTLHVYGFFPRELHPLLHPRAQNHHWQRFLDENASLRRRVLRYLGNHPEAHPRDVERALNVSTTSNAWGGQSSRTTLILAALQYVGRARVVRRESGQRVYAEAQPLARSSAAARAQELVRWVVRIYAPISLRSLRSILAASRVELTPHPRDVIAPLIKRGVLQSEPCSGDSWVWLADQPRTTTTGGEDAVRLLAPFDPIVWDRRRFSQLWNWDYRFEAYTPRHKRKLGYYALPLLWRDNIIGWANATTTAHGLDVATGFVAAKPRDRVFARALDAEIARLSAFLVPR